jgi:CBS domain-containing protein
MLNKTPISDIMTKDLFILEASDTLRDAENTFRNYRLRHAPVMSGGELVGMLSMIDLKSKDDEPAPGAFGMDAQYMPTLVHQVMTPDPMSVQVSASILEVAEIFTENDFHAIPVLDGEKIVGIVSTTDIIKCFLDHME